MIDEWIYLVRTYTLPGARSKFEDICATLFKNKYRGEFVKAVKVEAGDGGIDVFVGDIAKQSIKVIQCKFFVNGLGDSQKEQIRNSFKTVIGSTDSKTSKWILCLPDKLTINEHTWWSGWKDKQIKAYGLDKDFVELMDGDDLIGDLKKFKLYDEVFDLEYRTSIKDIHNAIIGNSLNLDQEILSASSYVGNLKNYFSKSENAHIQRKEVDDITAWVKNDLPGKNRLEKVLVLKGKKGVGKSTVLRNVYWKLFNEDEYLVLAIKCDQFYDVNLEGIAKQLFTNILSFRHLQSVVATQDRKFILILDQLDALSQMLSKDRRLLLTYIKLIDDFINLANTRIVISTRSFDLEYDADLRMFNETQHIKHVEMSTLSKIEVTDILKVLNIETKSDFLIELLTIPYNLELFTKIPNLENLLQKDTRISMSKLYSELWSQVLANKELDISGCLNEIVKRMYELHPNLTERVYLEKFKSEIDYLASHDILKENGDKLSFFHQSFYEYYLARWFVLSNKNLIEYIVEEEQNLYIRSLIKMVIDYLRETDHSKYISLYKDVIGDEKIRYHIKYLFILELAIIDMPSEKEKAFVCNILSGQMGKLFMELFSSSGWTDFFIANNLFDKSIIYNILHRNINHRPKQLLEYLENSDILEKAKLIQGIIPSITIWNNDLLLFFDRYYPYNDRTELWFFEILKKIAPFDLEFVLKKLRPVILSAKTKNERLRFGHRYERIIDFLHQQNSKSLAEFLLSIHLEILEDTKYPYYSEYSNISSPLFSSLHYDNGLFYRESKEDKSIDFHLLKYYRECERVELKKLIVQYADTNYVSLLILLTKLIRDRASEFVEESYHLLLLIEAKNGLKQIDDFFQLNIRRMIAKSILYYDNEQYLKTKEILLGISHPYEVWKYSEEGKKRYSLSIGKKKFLFIKSLPNEIVQKDIALRKSLQELERRFGVIDHDKALDRNNGRFGAVGSPLSNADFEKFDLEAWLRSMRKIDENFKSDDFFKGGLLEHSRSFENQVTKRPDFFYDFISKLFLEEGISYSYISHGISGLIKAKYDGAKVAELVRKEIRSPLDREFMLYATWHTTYLIEEKQVTDDIVEFLTSISRSDKYQKDVLNPDDPISDFINTTRGSAINNLFHLYEYPTYKEAIFGAIESAVSPKNNPSTTILAGVMSQLAYLNHLDIERSFLIFKKLVLSKNPQVLKYSINPAQYFNNKFHGKMKFYFDEMLLHPELHDKCYFFVSSWIFEEIDDFEIYDHFMGLGENALKCALDVAEDFLIEKNIVNDRAMRVIKRCMSHSAYDLSHELSGTVLRKFKLENFLALYEFMELYVSTVHFANDPRYLFEFLTECSSVYPVECLRLMEKMIVPSQVDITMKAYLGDEPLVLVLAIYSRLRLEPYRYRQEQQTALDQFDKLLGIPSIRYKALEAMENVLN